jgi:hypothetical protein
MKKFGLALILAIVAIYGFGFVTLSETGTDRFLDELETMSMTGRGAEYCARLHEDLKVSIRDQGAEPPTAFEGGREEFCDYVTYAMKGIATLGISTRVTRSEFSVTRSWLHPWTLDVSYHEDRITRLSKTGTTLHEVSDDRITLVRTFEGVKLLNLESKVGRAP